MSIAALPRRYALILCCALLALLALPSASAAVSAARQALETSTNRILACIKNPD